ncbi:MAG: UDP-2,3-diacylglucosamine diphosphatase LpxI, partial [Hyphomicrobiales bacterium]|nr:UDP-2,3-diacylglucosamine diphosphatase LpxI [Hyphomicrobiales bacterium]
EHYWTPIGKLGALLKQIRAADCRELIFIGTLVRPAISEIRLDWGTLRVMPSLLRAFRGGDDHLLTSVSRLFEQQGFHLLGVKDVAPDLLMPAGHITRTTPDGDAQADIARGRAVLHALSPFDIGQACVVIDGHVVGIEDIGGTDALLARVAELRTAGRIRAKAGRGVLVKAPKSSQDLRFDLPATGPRTVEGAIAARLAGIAIVAGNTIVAEPQAMIETADGASIFVTGLPA